MSVRSWTSDPVHDAELYAIERHGSVIGYCAACDGEICGRSRRFDGDTYILDDEGNMIHPRLRCMKEHFGEKILDWMIEDYGKKEIVNSMLDAIKRPDRWLLEQCRERSWVQG